MRMEKHPFLIGDTSSNGCFSIVIRSFSRRKKNPRANEPQWSPPPDKIGTRLCRRDFQQAKRTRKRNNNEKLLGNGFLLATTFVLFGRVAFLLGRSFHHVGFNCKASSLSRGNKHIREILNWFILLPIFGRFAKISI